MSQLQAQRRAEAGQGDWLGEEQGEQGAGELAGGAGQGRHRDRDTEGG